MPLAVQNLDRLPVAMRPAVGELAEQILGTFGGALLNWSIFGDAAAGHFDPNRNTVRNALVLRNVDLEAVRSLAKSGSRFGPRGLVAPLILTPDFIAKSLDTFPLELIEIQQQSIAILGDNPLTDVRFDERHVRLQCEREMKTVEVALCQGLLSTHDRRELYSGVIHNVVERLSRTLRGMLWLKGRRAFLPLEEVIRSVEALAGRQLPGTRNAAKNFRASDWEMFERLYAEVATLGAIIDGW